MKYQQGKSGLITSLSNGSVAFWSHDPHGPEFILDCHSKSVNKILYDDSTQTLITCSSDQKIKFWQLPPTWPSEIMRENKDFNEKNFIEEYTCNTNNLMKIQDAIKDLNFNDVEGDYVHVSPRGEQSTQFSQSNRNSIRKKSSIDKTETTEELIDTSYIYQEGLEQDDTSLDGWENDAAMGLYTKRNGFSQLYDFIGV
jgi:WD40 repeat protein